MGLNVFSFTGHLTRDAVLKQVGAKGSTLMDFAVANNTGYGQYAKVSFVNCQMWGERCNNLAPYLLKGTGVYCTGTMEQQKWTDTLGVEQTRWVCTVQDIGFISGKKDSQGGSNPQMTDEEVVF